MKKLRMAARVCHGKARQITAIMSHIVSARAQRDKIHAVTLRSGIQPSYVLRHG